MANINSSSSCPIPLAFGLPKSTQDKRRSTHYTKKIFLPGFQCYFPVYTYSPHSPFEASYINTQKHSQKHTHTLARAWLANIKCIHSKTRKKRMYNVRRNLCEIAQHARMRFMQPMCICPEHRAP